MPLRETRRFKTKSSVVSFGDIMLPLVGIIAIALLVVAGKLFFFSGWEGNRSPLPRIEDRARVSQREQPAPAEEAVSERVSSPTLPSASVDPSQHVLEILAVPYDSKISPVSTAPVTVVIPSSTWPSVTPKPSPKPSVTARATATQKPPVATLGKGTASKPKTDTALKKDTTPKNTSWMVQIGAFSTRASANAISQQVTKRGYSATVITGKNFHRVLIKAGPTREEALALATQMSKNGFQGAFIVPPRQ